MKNSWNRAKVTIAGMSFIVASILGLYAVSPAIRCLFGSKLDCPANLETEVEADYSQLKTLLESKRFKEADRETARLMLWITNRTKQGWIEPKGITTQQFPCKDILTIDALWLSNSNGKFGFSIQKRIWQEVRQTEKFGDKVGWRENNKWLTTEEINYDLRPPEGRLPSTSRVGSLSGGWLVWPFLLDSAACRL